ncbi:MAG: tetratricopeptide repeat protein [Sandaracinaceae bacterium]|nr:tetratricopeptide repeat protein [Sandaracinaceae bacterium]
MRTALLAALVLLSAAPASAQPSLREQGRVALREGRFEDALRLFRFAVDNGGEPTLWLDVGDAADRLRADGVALEAYERYLEVRPDAPDRVEVLARVQVLRAVLHRPRADRADFIPTSTILDALEHAPPESAPLGLGRRLSAP